MSKSRIGLTPGLTKFLVARTTVILGISELEDRAHRCGMHLTAAVLNRAKNCAGWEVQARMDEAAAAGRGERPGDGTSKRKPR